MNQMTPKMSAAEIIENKNDTNNKLLNVESNNLSTNVNNNNYNNPTNDDSFIEVTNCMCRAAHTITLFGSE